MFANLLLVAVEREERRAWSRTVAPGSLTFDQAVDRVAQVFEEQWMVTEDGPGGAVFEGLLALNKVFGTMSPDSSDVDAPIVEARDNFETHMALRLLAYLSPAGMYPNLDRWKADVFLEVSPTPRRPTGPAKWHFAHRNMLIVGQVRQLEAIGFRPTRSPGSRKDRPNHSGCDAVAAATHRLVGHKGIKGMTYAAVESVWKKGSKPLTVGLAGEAMEAFVGAHERRRKN